MNSVLDHPVLVLNRFWQPVHTCSVRRSLHLLCIGHAEVVQVVFDPKKITYEKILAWFWDLHDPTTLNRQGNDVGTQYRSGIYFTTPEQRQEAQALLDQLAVELEALSPKRPLALAMLDLDVFADGFVSAGRAPLARRQDDRDGAHRATAAAQRRCPGHRRSSGLRQA